MNYFRSPGSHFNVDREDLTALFEQLKHGYYKVIVKQDASGAIVNFVPQSEWLGETVSFRISGIPGPQGPQGPQGEQGPQGKQGPRGESDIRTMLKEMVVPCVRISGADYTVSGADYVWSVSADQSVTVFESLGFSGSKLIKNGESVIMPAELLNRSGQFFIVGGNGALHEFKQATQNANGGVSIKGSAPLLFTPITNNLPDNNFISLPLADYWGNKPNCKYSVIDVKNTTYQAIDIAHSLGHILAKYNQSNT